MYVQFDSPKQELVVSVFDEPQDAVDFPNQGEVDSDDPRYIAFIEPPAPVVVDPLDKLAAFLSENPDVANKVGL